MEYRRLTLGALAALAALAPRAAEARARSRLAYSAEPSTCPPEEALRSAVAARLGYPPFAPDAGESIATTIRRDGDALVAEITRTAADGAVLGARTLTTKGDCAELVASAAVTISILLDPRSFMGPPSAPPPPDPHETPPPSAPIEPERSEAPPPAPPPPDGEPVVPRLGVVLLGSAGTAPAPSVGFEAFAGLARGPWSVAVGGRADLPASTLRDDGAGVRASLLLAEVAACRHASIFGFCAFALGGALFGEGIGVGAPDRATTAFVALGPRLVAEIPIVGRRVFLRGQLDAVAAVTRATLRVRGEPLWTSPPVAGGLGVGAVALFP